MKVGDKVNTKQYNCGNRNCIESDCPNSLPNHKCLVLEERLEGCKINLTITETFQFNNIEWFRLDNYKSAFDKINLELIEPEISDKVPTNESCQSFYCNCSKESGKKVWSGKEWYYYCPTHKMEIK